MVASMLRAQRRDPAKAHAKWAFATNYPLANRQLRSSLILRYRMQRDKPLTLIVFVVFSYFWFGEEPTIRTIVGFSLIAVGASIVFAR